MTEERCNCPVELKPMAEWINEEDLEKCRPCLLGPVAQWYVDQLREKGKIEEASKLEGIALKTDVGSPESILTLCQEFDRIKDAVEEPLRERLKDFDCSVQAFDPATEEE